jgi:ABC-2 type transport system ATP-binding protein
VKHDGKLVSFIELGVGFNSELTGKENVYLNGALLGFSKAEVEAMYDDIVEFAELEKFMDQTLKNYSSGMKVRLAFSVAIRAKADILILDEVLAVGDAAFKKKCSEYFHTLKDSKQTVILVTHSMSDVMTYCDKAIVIEDGKILFEGGPERAAEVYQELFDREKGSSRSKRRGSFRVKINDIAVKVTKTDITVSYGLVSKQKINDIKIAVDIRKKGGGLVAGVPGAYFTSNPVVVDGNHGGKAVFDNRLFDGEYTVYIRLRSVDDGEVFDDWDEAVSFSINTFGAESIIPANLFIEDKSQL